MKKCLCLFLFTLAFLFSKKAQGQIDYGYAFLDSFSFHFSPTDSLHHPFDFGGSSGNITIDTAHADSANTYLWQIGNTEKTFFANNAPTARGIMTDTINMYPVNANSWFVMKFFDLSNVVISFRHRYQTSLGHDGGIVEFSNDKGVTWQNVIGDCLNQQGWMGMQVDSFYNAGDTLLTGEPAFTGSHDWMLSKFQFFAGFSPKTNGGQGCQMAYDSLEVRFRFVSDTIPDTLAGWMIGNINIQQDFYLSGGVPQLNKYQTLNVYPNPSTDAIYNFPALDKEKDYSMELMKAMGSTVMKMPYRKQVDLSVFPAGLYFYRVTNGDMSYSGKLLRE